MLQVNFLRDNNERVMQGLKKRNFKQLGLVDDAIAADDERKKYQFDLDQNLAEMNRISKEIGTLMKEGRKEEAEAAKIKTAEFKENAQNLQQKPLVLSLQTIQTDALFGSPSCNFRIVDRSHHNPRLFQ